MQPYYEMANNTFYHQQNLTLDEVDSSILHTQNHIHHPILQHYHYSQSPQQYQPLKEQCHQQEEDFQHFYQSHQLQHPHKFQLSQQQTHSLDDHHFVNRYIQCQESTTRVSFWKAFNNTVLSDSIEKQHETVNNRCLVSDNNLGELEAVYKPGQNEAFIEEESSKKKARKKKRKKKVREEMRLMSGFFKRLMKRVINHQEVLQNKMLDAIERMEKERIVREEKWRREESEMYEREAIVKERERDLAKWRESSIVSSIEKITGTRFNLCVKMNSS